MCVESEAISTNLSTGAVIRNVCGVWISTNLSTGAVIRVCLFWLG